MSRVDELTVRLLDGEASAAEVVELERLVAEDQGARHAALRLHQVEVVLRGGRREVGAAAAVMERIGRERSERVVRGVMTQVQAAQPAWRQVAPAGRRRWLWPAAAAAVLALGAAASAAMLLLRPRAPHLAGGDARGAGGDERGGERAARPPPALLPVPPPPAGTGARESAVVLFNFDFEDGELPDDFIDGHVVGGSCPAGSRHCALGTVSPYLGRTHTIAVERVNPPLFVHAPGQVLSFDYWVGGDARAITIQGWSKARRQNYGAELRDLVRESWTRVELPVTELVGYRDGERLQAGEPVTNIVIKAGKVGGKPFYVDNLRLVQVVR